MSPFPMLFLVLVCLPWIVPTVTAHQVGTLQQKVLLDTRTHALLALFQTVKSLMVEIPRLHGLHKTKPSNCVCQWAQSRKI